MVEGSRLTPFPPTASKDAHRKRALAGRNALLPTERVRLSNAICAHLNGVRGAWGGPVAGYLPIRSEADIQPFLAELALAGEAICLPRILPDDSLSFLSWKPGDALAQAGFGTLAPPGGVPVLNPRTVLVPLAAFDRHGGRIGYGKGFYDRALAGLRQIGAVTAIGIAFSVQECDDIPVDAHDQPLDAVVTETGLRSFVQV